MPLGWRTDWLNVFRLMDSCNAYSSMSISNTAHSMDCLCLSSCCANVRLCLACLAILERGIPPLWSFYFFPKDLRVEGVATVQKVKHSPAISFANFVYPTKFDWPSVIMAFVALPSSFWIKKKKDYRYQIKHSLHHSHLITPTTMRSRNLSHWNFFNNKKRKTVKINYDVPISGSSKLEFKFTS